MASGLAHGKEWALASTDMRRLTEPMRPLVLRGTITASEPVALELTSVAVSAVTDALADLEAYAAAP